MSHYWPFRWVSVTLDLAAQALYITYPVLTWHRLNQVLADEPLFERTKRKHVILATVVSLMTPIIVPVSIYEPVAIATGVIYLLCWIFLCSLPAKQLKSIELKRNAGVWEYAPDTFNFLLWPLGIFWIQPRLNRLLEKRIIIEE